MAACEVGGDSCCCCCCTFVNIALDSALLSRPSIWPELFAEFSVGDTKQNNQIIIIEQFET